MSNIYDKSSLVLIPSGTKTGKIFSQKPVSGDGDFTFTRASAATRVNADGNIEKETQNFLTYSNDFSNGAWVKSNLSVALLNGAWELSDNTASGSHYLYWSGTTPASSVLTLSVDAKAGAENYLAMRLGGYTYAFFDLVNGTPIANASFIDLSMEATADGFYRCSATILTPSTNNNSVFYSSDNSSSVSYTGTGSVAITIKNAQLEQGLVARDYIETTTAAVYGGVTDNTPRLDYTDSSCPALLLEPQRTNFITNSEYLNADWSEFRSTLIVNDDTSPEGVNNATKLQEDTTASNTHFTGKGYTYVSGTTYSWSVYAKADGRDEIAIQQGNPAVISFNARFNFTSETAFNFGNGTARIEDAGNGWYRCIIEGTTALLSSGTNINVFLRSGDSTTYTGDGTSGVLLYGFQLEEGSYATSYIPTYGSSVSRVGETCTKGSASSVIGQNEGVIFAEVDFKGGSSTDTHRFNINDSGSNNWIFVSIEGGSNLRYYIRVGSNTYIDGNVGNKFVAGNTYKIALRYKSGDTAVYINGIEIGSGNTTAFPSPTTPFSRYSITGSANNSNPVQFTQSGVKQTLLFPTSLSNEELADLTTL